MSFAGTRQILKAAGPTMKTERTIRAACASDTNTTICKTLSGLILASLVRTRPAENRLSLQLRMASVFRTAHTQSFSEEREKD